MNSSTSLDNVFKQLVELFEAKLEGASTLEVDIVIGNKMNFIRSKTDFEPLNEQQAAILRVVEIVIDEWNKLTKAERVEVTGAFRDLLERCHAITN